MPNSKFTIPLLVLDQYKYTKLQAIICPYDNDLSQSVSADKVVINDNVYEVNSNISISEIIENDMDKSIDLGITNNTDKPSVLRYFTYKEIK